MNAPRLGGKSGQAIVFVVALLTILLGLGALVVDGGSWLRAQRHLQTAADAAALAGAQDLPTDLPGAVVCAATSIVPASGNVTVGDGMPG